MFEPGGREEAPEGVQAAGAEWLGLWVRTRDALVEQRSWREEQAGALESYVHAVRLEKFHREQAELAPYARGDNGRIYSHPGFANAREAGREARALAEQLVLSVAARRACGLSVESETFGPFDDLG